MIESILFIWKSIKGYRFHYFLMMLATFSDSFYTPVLYWSIKSIIDIVSENQDFSYYELTKPFVIFVSIHILGHLIWRISDIARYYSDPNVKKNLLLNFFKKVQLYKMDFFLINKSGKLSSKARGVLDGYDNIWSDLKYGLMFNSLALISHTASIFFININIGLIVMIWNIIFFIIMYFATIKLHLRAEEYSHFKHLSINSIIDKLQNIISIKLFSSEKKEEEILSNEIDSGFIVKQKAFYRLDFLVSIFSNIMQSIMVFSVLFLAIIYKKQKIITIGDFSFIFTMIWDLMHHIQDLSAQLLKFSSKSGDLSSSFDILLESKKNKFKSNIEPNLKIEKYDIEINDLSFRYENTKNSLFNNINLHIKENEKIGIVGFSGSGKTTLLNILCNIIDNYQGKVKIGGNDIKNIKQIEISSNIGIIHQDMKLFNRSILDNIVYGVRNFSNESFEKAIKDANIYDFIQSLPEKENTILDKYGLNISPGQLQRILMARIFLQDPKIIILDEATKSIDYETEKKIYQSLLNFSKNKTLIIVAHHLNALMGVEKILFIDKDGSIAESGTKDELMKKKGYFYKMWHNQFYNFSLKQENVNEENCCEIHNL